MLLWEDEAPAEGRLLGLEQADGELRPNAIHLLMFFKRAIAGVGLSLSMSNPFEVGDKLVSQGESNELDEPGVAMGRLT